MRGFHRNDFTGSEGPGLAKLRAAKLQDDGRAAFKRVADNMGLALVRDKMHKDDWHAAILAAAKFPELGDQAAAIHRGREALLRPAFQRQLKRDPAQLIEEAKAALIARFGR